MFTATCLNCGKSYTVIDSRKNKTKFCSPECQHSYRRGPNDPRWVNDDRTVTCLYCGKEFTIKPYRRSKAKFCSPECKAASQRGQPHTGQRKSIERICEVCGKQFFVKPSVLKRPGWGRFCSKACFAQVRRLRFLWNNPNLRKDVHAKQMANWQKPELRERRIQNTLKVLLKRPTSLEQRLIKFFAGHNLPFKYVGDGSFLIGFKNPDFINTNGRKIAIEVSNAFFHKNKPHWAEQRKAHFAKYGWDCIVLETDKSYLSDSFLISTIGRQLEVRGIYGKQQRIAPSAL